MRVVFFVFLIATYFSQHSNAQELGRHPYKFYVGYNGKSGTIYSERNDSIHYSSIHCGFNPMYFQFSEPIPLSSFTRNSGESTLRVAQPETVTQNLSFPLFMGGQQMPTQTLILANGKDTVAIIDHQAMPFFEFNRLGIATENEEDPNIIIKGREISFCNADEEKVFHITPVFNFRKSCSRYNNFGQQISLIKNGVYIPDYNYTPSQFQDGDSIWFQMNNFGFDDCECFSSTNYTSIKYKVTKSSFGKFTFPEKIRSICPGDTIQVESPLELKEVYWYSNASSPNYFFRNADTTIFKLQVLNPSRAFAWFFKPSGGCPMKTDTIDIVLANDCPYGFIRGYLFNDVNRDKNNGGMNEGYLPYQLLKIDPGNQIISTQSSGNFSAKVPNGQKISISLIPFDNMKSDTVVFDFTNKNKFNSQIYALIPAYALLDKDVQVEISSNRMRPGFQAKYIIDFINNGNIAMEGSLEVEIDTLLKDINFSESPTDRNGNKFTWRYNSLYPFIQKKIIGTGTVPADVKLIGKEITAYTSFTAPTDSYLPNNTDTIRTIITGSYDPNDKTAFADNGTKAVYISEDKTLEYLIRFQNKGTDTAFTVVVKDTIAATLDISQLKMRSASHPYTLDIINNSILVWTFDYINLPDDKTNEPASHGYIKFSIGQNKKNTIGTQLLNKAHIYFDFNPAIETNEEKVMVGELFTITELKNILNHDHSLIIQPNPASEAITIRSSLDGQLEISNALGKVLTSHYFSGEEVIPTTHLNPGVYILKISDNIQSLTRKLIIK